MMPGNLTPPPGADPMPMSQPMGQEPPEDQSQPPQALQMLQEGLARLTPEEQQELDLYIDGRLAELLEKMLGPEVGVFLQQFVGDDEQADEGDSEGEMDPIGQGAEAVPYSTTPIREVKARGFG